jgi:hypothetical protein
MVFQLTEEQQMVRDMARRFADEQIRPVAAELDKTHRHPEEIIRQMAELKFLGIAVPEEYGGGGMDYVSYVLAMIEISKACASTGVIMSVNNSLYCYPLMAYGTHEQKVKYLEPVASGRSLGCYGLTEAGAGSDPAPCAPMLSGTATAGFSTAKRNSSPRQCGRFLRPGRGYGKRPGLQGHFHFRGQPQRDPGIFRWRGRGKDGHFRPAARPN